MPHEKTPPLVDCRWLSERLGTEGIVVVDASFYLPNQGRNAKAEYLSTHIPGASFFDIDEIADRSSGLPHMLPSPEQFSRAVGAMGVDNDTWVIAYDHNAFMASARAWWTFRTFGHDRVSVLDGGLARWLQEGYPADAATPDRRAREFKADFRPELVRDIDRMRALLDRRDVRVLDARSPGRYAGIEPEPRAGVRSGHMPGARNLSYRNLVDETTHRLKSPETLAELYRLAGVTPGQPVVTTCGTGVTAAILALGLYILGDETVAVYDGSWTEWGGRTDTPAILGPDA